MSRTFLRFLATGGALVLAAPLALAQGNTVNTSPGSVGAPGSKSVVGAGGQWKAELQPTKGQNVSGTVAVAPGETAGTQVVTVAFSGGQPGATYPWQIETGTCGSTGTVVDSKASYPPLKAGATGSAHGLATLKSPLRPGNSYQAVVMQSAAKNAGPLACGEFKAATTAQ